MNLNLSQKIGAFVGGACGLYLSVLSSTVIVDFLYEHDWMTIEDDTTANHVVAAFSTIIAPLSILLAAEAGLLISSKLTCSSYNTSISRFNLCTIWKSADSALESFVNSSEQSSKQDDDKMIKMA